MKKWLQWVKDQTERKAVVEKMAAVCAVVVLYVGMGAIGIGCPIKYVTGISCAGCGMTRAWLAMLQLQWGEAFYYHPLFWTPPIGLFVLCRRKQLPKWFYVGALGVLVALFLVVYVWRLCLGEGDIVVFAPQKGLVFRLFSWLFIKK